MKKIKGSAQITTEGMFVFEPYSAGGAPRYTVKRLVSHGALLETSGDYILKIKVSKKERRAVEIFLKETAEAITCLAM